MIELPPQLTHEVAAGFALDLKRQVQLQPGGVVADASALQTFDSSALAVLLACRREALAADKTFSVQGLAPRLRQLATLYGVGELIPPMP
jgi:phospholipid transport system transporter-binding protein